MKNLDQLLKLRQSNLRPSTPVWIDFLAERVWPLGDGPVVLKPEYEGEMPDLRPLLGLDVLIHADEFTAYVQSIFERSKLYANSVTTLITAFGDDIGYAWHKGYGQATFDDQRWLIQYEDARTSVCKTNEETQRRLALEMEAAANAPWVTGVRHG